MVTKIKPKVMNFTNGTLLLTDRHAQRQYHGGGGERIVRGDKVVSSPVKWIKFVGHRYQTDDRDIARKLLAMDDNFEHPWGFAVDPRCLPEEIRKVWHRVDRDDRIAAVAALIEGKSAEETLKVVSLIDLREKKAKSSQKFACPATGCDVTSVGKNAHEALKAHFAIMHAEMPLSMLST